MSRLPTVGGDDGTWGDVLNDFLDVSHNSDGSLKSSSVVAAGGVLAANNLSDLTNTSTARTNLGAIGAASTDTLTNKTISGASNTFSNIPETAVTSLSTDLANRVVVDGLVVNVKDHGATGNGSTDDSTAINAVLTTAAGNPGTIVYFPKGIYLVNHPLIIPGFTTLVGTGWGSTTQDQTTIKLGNGSSGATWNKWGVLTSSIAAGNAASAGNSIFITDMKIDGNNSSNGNAIVLMNQQSRVQNVRIANFIGTTAGSDGYGIWFAGQTIPNSDVLVNNCVANTVINCRVGCNNSRIYSDDSGSRYTDGQIQNFVCISQTTPSNIDDINLNHAGGWTFDMVHTNGSGAAGIHLGNVFNTTIVNCYLDGWGIGNTSGTTNCIRIDNYSTGGGGTSDIIIANNRFKGRAEQVSPGVYNVIALSPSANQGKANITGNLLYTETLTGTVNFLSVTGAASQLLGQVNSNEFDISQATAGTPFGTAAQTNNLMNFTGNSFNFGAAAPSAGWYPAGFVVWNSAPAAGGAPGFVCTTAGTPGTWKAMANLAA
jgi:hypothetical protein